MLVRDILNKVIDIGLWSKYCAYSDMDFDDMWSMLLLEMEYLNNDISYDEWVERKIKLDSELAILREIKYKIEEERSKTSSKN